MAVTIDRFEPRRTALIVVDMQHDFIAPGAPLETPMGRAILPSLDKALAHARATGMRVVFTEHVHRSGGADMGLFGEIWPPIGKGAALVDETSGVEVIPELAPRDGELVVKKHRYSAFFGTDLDLVLRGGDVENVVITGVTTENCCHATARDAMFRDYRVAFLSDATGTFDYPDSGQGVVPAEEVHRVTLAVLGVSTAHVMTTGEFIARTTGTAS